MNAIEDAIYRIRNHEYTTGMVSAENLATLMEKELSALRSEIERLKAEREWQPMSSAPVISKGFYIGLLDGYWTKMSWDYYRDGWIDYFTDDYFEPTHYLNLPQPPEEK